MEDNEILENGFLSVYFTSEANSYGAFNFNWFDGKPYKEVINFGSLVSIGLQPIEHKYLDDDSQCSQSLFVDHWKTFLMLENFSKCEGKCTPTTIFQDILPLCGWNETKIRDCTSILMSRNYLTYQSKIDFSRPCYTLEYIGDVEYQDELDWQTSVTFDYHFQPPVMTITYNEYLIFDILGMVGFVGGTLGLFIGFSFSGAISAVLDYIQAKIMTLCLKIN